MEDYYKFHFVYYNSLERLFIHQKAVFFKGGKGGMGEGVFLNKIFIRRVALWPCLYAVNKFE